MYLGKIRAHVRRGDVFTFNAARRDPFPKETRGAAPRAGNYLAAACFIEGITRLSRAGREVGGGEKGG